MKDSKSFPFNQARRITHKEVTSAKKAIESLTGKKRPLRGRPAKSHLEKFIPTSIRLHPKVLRWAKNESKKRGVGYQTIINEALLKNVA